MTVPTGSETVESTSRCSDDPMGLVLAKATLGLSIKINRQLCNKLKARPM